MNLYTFRVNDRSYGFTIISMLADTEDEAAARIIELNPSYHVDQKRIYRGMFLRLESMVSADKYAYTTFTFEE